jgi:excisionase family DNA binding protein
MRLEATRDGYDGYCGTSYAAKLLKLSVGTVQNLVESNSLKAWRTQGGHRRISLRSIQEYLLVNKLDAPTWHFENGKLRVLLIEDDETSRIMYQAHFDQWALPTDVVMYASAMEALLDMPSMQPQVLLTDLNMPGMDGFEFLKTVREYKLFKSLPIIVMTGLSNEQINEKGGLPTHVQILQKPIDMKWLRGFLEAIINLRKIIPSK